MAGQQRHQKVINALVKQIFLGKLKPETKLPTEKQLSARMKVDRTSLRLALKQLEAMKVLSIRQGDGIYVKDYLKNAGLDFLGLSFQEQEKSRGKWGIDAYIMDEIWEFWTLFSPPVLELALKRCSTRDIKSMAELLELQEKYLGDRKKMAEIEISFQDKTAAIINNTILLLLFNSLRPLRKKTTQILIDSLDQKGLKGLIETKRILLEKAMKGSDADIAQAAEMFRERCQASRQKLRESMSSTPPIKSQGKKRGNSREK